MKKQTMWSGSHNCDICGKVCQNTLYDARTRFGAWGTMCEECFQKHGAGIGTGNGQKYQLNPNTGSFEKMAGQKQIAEVKNELQRNKTYTANEIHLPQM